MHLKTRKEKVDCHGFKVSFELHPSCPHYNQNYDDTDSNNCEVILENVPGPLLLRQLLKAASC